MGVGNKKALSWQESVLKVLTDERRAMKYDEIAERIIALKLRPSEKIGSTPANTVNVTLRNLINDGSETVVCLRRGVYILKRALDENPSLAADKEEDTLVDEEELESTLITAYGRFWSRFMWEENEKQI